MLSLSETDDLVLWVDESLKVVYTNRPDREVDPLTHQMVTDGHEESAVQSSERHPSQRLSDVLRLQASDEWSQVMERARLAPIRDLQAAQVLTEAEPIKVSLSIHHAPSQGQGDHWVIIGAPLENREERSAQRINADTRELTEAMRQLERVNAELAKTAQAKDEFLASMSHELRTPLNAIMGLGEALLEGVYGKLDADQHQPIRQIFSNGHHLLSVISDILDLSKLRAGGISLSLSDIDVEGCCFEALQVFRAEMQKKRLSVNVSIEGIYILNADERWFKQVLMNLLNNAVKFTPADRKLGIIVGESPNVGHLRVTVWDEGIGIKQEDLPRLFQTFVQLDTSLARAYEGTGLGLSIVSSVMQLHGGQVSVESERGEGSKFHLDFPWLSEVGSLSSDDLTPTPSSLNSILLVEDSEIDADRVKRFLGELDTEVYWDQRGSEALHIASEQVPDIIILDLFLPESSGWEILKNLKSTPHLSKIPVIVCSVLERDDHRPESKLVEAYLQKPFSRRALQKALREALMTQSADELDPKKTLVISAQETSMKPSSSLKHAEENIPREVESPAPHKILIVDDNLSNIQLVNDYLCRKGYFILTAEDGYQAVQVARAHLPDLILMDIQMPHMDGIEATTHLKADPRVSHIPIFALTALAMPGDRERCLEAGMDDYFTKPVSLRGLYKKIKETFEATPQS